MVFQHILGSSRGSRCTGRCQQNGGPDTWPARSPDLNPLDFYFWGQLHQLFYD